LRLTPLTNHFFLGGTWTGTTLLAGWLLLFFVVVCMGTQL
jgi:hypothetical protein